MLLALLLAGCWRPEPYEPPPPPEPADEDVAAAPDAEGDDAEEAPDDPDADALSEGETPPRPDEEDVPTAPDFVRYAVRTVQAPVTIVDDWGKPLAVLGRSGWELEVRGEEPIRTRVWCGGCDPSVEGWIQPHLIARSE